MSVNSAENVSGQIVILTGETNYENTDEEDQRQIAAQPHCHTASTRHEVRHRGRDKIYQGNAMTRDELIDIISDVTTLLGDALTKYVELSESIAGAGVESQKFKLDSLKAKLAGERVKLAKLKDAAKRRRELEKANQHQPLASRPTANEGKSSSGMLTLRDAAGKVVGYVRVMKNRTEYFGPTGKLVAREIGGATYDFSRGGRLASRDPQGLRILGAASSSSAK